jgi:hypothetical protein
MRVPRNRLAVIGGEANKVLACRSLNPHLGISANQRFSATKKCHLLNPQMCFRFAHIESATYSVQVPAGNTMSNNSSDHARSSPPSHYLSKRLGLDTSRRLILDNDDHAVLSLVSTCLLHVSKSSKRLNGKDRCTRRHAI